jgi:hypothetical protein
MILAHISFGKHNRAPVRHDNKTSVACRVNSIARVVGRLPCRAYVPPPDKAVIETLEDVMRRVASIYIGHCRAAKQGCLPRPRGYLRYTESKWYRMLARESGKVGEGDFLLVFRNKVTSHILKSTDAILATFPLL